LKFASEPLEDFLMAKSGQDGEPLSAVERLYKDMGDEEHYDEKEADAWNQTLLMEQDHKGNWTKVIQELDDSILKYSKDSPESVTNEQFNNFTKKMIEKLESHIDVESKLNYIMSEKSEACPNKRRSERNFRTRVLCPFLQDQNKNLSKKARLVNLKAAAVKLEKQRTSRRKIDHARDRMHRSIKGDAIARRQLNTKLNSLIN